MSKPDSYGESATEGEVQQLSAILEKGYRFRQDPSDENWRAYYAALREVIGSVTHLEHWLPSHTTAPTKGGARTSRRTRVTRATTESEQPARQFGNASPSEGELQISLTPRPTRQSFRRLPPPIGEAPYHLNLDSVLPASTMRDIGERGKLIFHAVGDTGGIGDPTRQRSVAWHMEQQLSSDDDPPVFFYHLGNVVYYYGEASEYYPQFYKPYLHYDAPIFAIPGNHDGDVLPYTAGPSLTAFAENFCAPRPLLTQEAQDAQRQAMTQPNVYFTLDAPFATIVGLYTNVPEGGALDEQQMAWFSAELQNASREKALIVAMHHPIYSADELHGGSAYLGQMVDQACAAAQRLPDLVLAAHVRNYQRFTRTVDERQIPYIVAGCGGFWDLHRMADLADGSPIPAHYAVPGTDARIETACDDRHGFLKLTIEPDRITGEFYAVPGSQESWRQPVQRLDSFVLDLKTHRVSTY